MSAGESGTVPPEGTPPVDQPAGTPPSPEPPSSPPSDWRDALPSDLRSNPTLERIDSIEALAKEHVNVQKLIGAEKIEKPKEDWTEDQWSEFYLKLGRPADPKDYELDIEIPEELPWDTGFQETMVGLMHKAGLSSAQANQLLKGYIDSVSGQYQEASGTLAQTREEGIQNLKNEWGKSFDAQVDLAKRAFVAGAGEGFDELAGLQLADGLKLGDHPAVIKAFATLGAKMSEHGLVGGTAQRTSLSPQEALGEKNKLLSDPEFLKAYMDNTHLEHRAAVKRINDLTEAEVASGQ